MVYAHVGRSGGESGSRRHQVQLPLRLLLQWLLNEFRAGDCFLLWSVDSEAADCGQAFILTS